MARDGKPSFHEARVTLEGQHIFSQALISLDHLYQLTLERTGLRCELVLRLPLFVHLPRKTLAFLLLCLDHHFDRSLGAASIFLLRRASGASVPLRRIGGSPELRSHSGASVSLRSFGAPPELRCLSECSERLRSFGKAP